MLQIAICDDNPVHLDHACGAVRQELASYLPEISLFSNADSLLALLAGREYRPDIAILDIEMEGTNGIELGRELNRLVSGCRIIYLTAYIDHAPEVYETEHVWFVLKSRMEEHMGPALRKALSDGTAPSPGPFGVTLRAKGNVRFIPLEEILYLSREGRKAQVVTVSGSYYSSARPSDLITEELEPRLIRCHQGYWVNIDRISSLDKEDFVLSDGSRIPISRTFRADARAKFFARYHL